MEEEVKKKSSCLGRVGSVFTAIIAIVIAGIILISLKLFLFVALNWAWDLVF